MWSQITLCCLVGIAFASQNSGWNQQNHYVYHVSGRSLASLNQISNDYSGIVFKAKLEVQQRQDGNLGAKISDAQYSKVHAVLSEGWETEFPESQLSYQPLPLSKKPFQIVYQNGVVKNVVVDKQIKNWEANMIKSIVNQFQLDLQGQNKIPSSINMLAQEDSDNAIFKTMEETVTGVSETLYEIHPYPEYVLQSKPWVVPHKHLNQDGRVIEIVKNKNFTHSQQSPSYHWGLEGVNGYNPGNKIGEFLTRASVSQAVITGSLKQYTIQSSVTVEEIVLSPTLGDAQKGSVNSKLNLTLSEVGQPRDEKQFNVESPVEVGLVYQYDKPYSTDNGPRSAQQFDHNTAESSAESQDPSNFRMRGNRIKSTIDENQDWQQDKPQLNEAAPSPLLPFTVGYDGQSFRKQQNIVETVEKLAKEIGQEFAHPKEIIKQQTAGKFGTLVSLVRTMDQNEVQQAAERLYRPEESPSWTTFRDAVAQAGTGPAIYNIKMWIENGKVSDYQAAQMIAVAADATRTPTEEYMKFFNDMIQDENLMSRPHLNVSALLSYTTLIRQVYVNREESYGKYPVHSYGSFYTQSGREFVKRTVIPYLRSQLKSAINDANTEKIHAYIRALGNIGQPEILEAFQPYLEGERKASHFQRVLMVSSLDQLAKNVPRTARSVLFKIYQNPAEDEHVRVAAVYQLMRTNPSATMLQRMASYTNVDSSNYVNAAVKSSIESATNLQQSQHQNLRTAAISAQPLLSSTEYGSQYSQGYLRCFAEQELHLAHQQHVQVFGGLDHALPKGIKYILQQQLGGVQQNILNAHLMVSSIEDLINVFQQQTKEYQNEQQEKEAANPSSYPWSSEYVAKLLNLQNEQREQLEGNMYLQLGALESLMSFDNSTLRNVPRVMQQWEQALRKNTPINYKKMLISKEIAVAFPTVLGLPFVYSYDRPLLISSEGQVKVTFNPQLASEQTLQKPDNAEAEFNLNSVVSGRIQTQLGIITPFDHQRHSAGYNKNFQVVVPLQGKIQLNIKKQELKVELQNPGREQNIRLAHFSSWPYTSQNEIYTSKPNYRIIKSDNPYRRNVVVGDKSTGVAIYFQVTSDQKIDYASLYNKLRHDPLSAVLMPWIDEHLHYVHMDAGIDSQKSTTQEINLRLSYQTDYKQNDPNQKKPDPSQQVSDIPSFAEDPEKRQQQFADEVGRYMNGAKILAGDATVHFQGQRNIKYSITFGNAKSNVDPQSSFIALARRVDKQEPHTVAYIQAMSKFANTNGLNLDYAMKMDPTSMVYVQGLLRHKQQQPSRFDADIHLSKSQQRVEYLKQQEEYKLCKRQMQQGNTQLPVCAKMTARANLLDKFEIKMKSSNMDPRIVNATYQAYSLLRHVLYPRIEENLVASNGNNHVDIVGQFSPDLQAVNASIVSQFGSANLLNVPVNKWIRELIVPHPVFHTRARLESQALKVDTYRPNCVVDKTETNTFDNRTFPTTLSNAWTVLLQYVPRRPSPVPNKPYQTVLEQMKQNVESYVVYGRAQQEGSGQKEIQIVFQMPKTHGKVVKIVLQSRQNKSPKVIVEDQEIPYNTKSSTDFYNGHVQVYGLPNEEVKVEIHEAFYVIFNGQTLKLTAVNSKFRDSSRGLCGTFTGESETDFLTPENCIVRNPEDFVNSYTVQSSRSKRAMSEKSGQCFQKKVVPAHYISNEDAGRVSEYGRRSGEECTGHLTRYVKKNGQICFTIRALPYCKSGCKASQTNEKPIDVYCMQPNSSTDHWTSRIDDNVNQDFSMKQPNERINMKVPAQCARS